jgi:hypothetical protein
VCRVRAVSFFDELLCPAEAEVLEDLASYAEEVGAGSKEDLLREVQETHGVDPLSYLVDLINERRSDASYPHSAVLSARASHANPFDGRQRMNRRGRQSRPARRKPLRWPAAPWRMILHCSHRVYLFDCWLVGRAVELQLCAVLRVVTPTRRRTRSSV